jgi:SulP family sulfate permease
MPALAALLIVAGYQGLRLHEAAITWNTSRVAGAVMVITFLATLFVPLQFAVLLGVALSVVLHVFQQSNKVVVTQWVLPPSGFPIEVAAPRQLASNQLTLLQIYGSLFFAAAKSVEEMLPAVGQARHAVVGIGLRGQGEIGSTFITVLQRYARALHAADCRLMLIGVGPEMHTQLVKTGTLKLIGEANVFKATPQIGTAMNLAVTAANTWLNQAPRAATTGASAPVTPRPQEPGAGGQAA